MYTVYFPDQSGDEWAARRRTFDDRFEALGYAMAHRIAYGVVASIKDCAGVSCRLDHFARSSVGAS